MVALDTPETIIFLLFQTSDDDCRFKNVAAQKLVASSTICITGLPHIYIMSTATMWFNLTSSVPIVNINLLGILEYFWQFLHSSVMRSSSFLIFESTVPSCALFNRLCNADAEVCRLDISAYICTSNFATACAGEGGHGNIYVVCISSSANQVKYLYSARSCRRHFSKMLRTQIVRLLEWNRGFLDTCLYSTGKGTKCRAIASVSTSNTVIQLHCSSDMK